MIEICSQNRADSLEVGFDARVLQTAKTSLQEKENGINELAEQAIKP